MVFHFGSQCGFNSQGIIMSLYGLWMKSSAVIDEGSRTNGSSAGPRLKPFDENLNRRGFP